jgi:hypothetical protein
VSDTGKSSHARIDHCHETVAISWCLTPESRHILVSGVVLMPT